MTILLLVLAGALIFGSLAWWLRRSAEDPSREDLDLGQGSDLSGRAEAAKTPESEAENGGQEEA